MMLLKRETQFKKIFYLIMICSIIFFFVAAIMSQGDSLESLLVFEGDRTDPVSDYFIGGEFLENDPYLQGTETFTPLSGLIYRSFYSIIPYEDIYAADDFVHTGSFFTQQSYMLTLILSFIIAFIFLLVGLAQLKEGVFTEKVIFIFVVMMSAPLLFLFERGNLIIFSLVLSVLFFVFYTSDNKIVSEFSIMLLALSVGINICTGLFGLILLREKRISQFIRFLIYGALAFFLPFFAFNGVESMVSFFENNFSDISRTIMTIPVFSLSEGAWVTIFILASIVGFIALFSVGERYQFIALCVCLFLLMPQREELYKFSFFIIPIALFLDNVKRGNWGNYLYLILFCVLMMNKPIPDGSGGWNIDATFAINMVAFCALTVLLIFGGVKRFVQCRRAKERIWGVWGDKENYENSIK